MAVGNSKPLWILSSAGIAAVYLARMYQTLSAASFFALILVASPASARDGRAYAGAEGGLLIMRTIEWDVSGKANVNQTDLHTGQFDAGIVAGYDFGVIRTEAELSYQRSRIHNYVVRFPTKLNGNPTIPAGFYPSATGFVHRMSAMVNVIAETGGNDRVGVFAGLGVGMTRGRAASFRIAGVDPFLDGSDNRPSWQFLAGARLPVTRHVEAGFRYRYQVGKGYRFTSRQGREPFKGDQKTLSLMGTLSWNF